MSVCDVLWGGGWGAGVRMEKQSEKERLKPFIKISEVRGLLQLVRWALA